MKKNFQVIFTGLALALPACGGPSKFAGNAGLQKDNLVGCTSDPQNLGKGGSSHDPKEVCPTPENDNLTCGITADKKTITLTESVFATLTSPVGELTSASINAIESPINKPTQFTPTTSGSFILRGIIKVGVKSATCSTSITVALPPAPPPIIPPSCAITAIRNTTTPTTCDATLTSTGGPIAQSPVLAGTNSMNPLANNTWNGSVNCPATGATLTAAVSNSGGTSHCSVVISPLSIPQPSPGCNLAVSRQTITLGDNVSVTLNSTGGPITSSSVNGQRVDAGTVVNFTPTAAGPFVLSGSVQGATSNATCSATVTVESPVCTISPNYDPQSVQCSINVKDRSSIWANTNGWNTLVGNFSDASANFISPLAQVASRGQVKCPMVPQSDQLVFVSHVQIPSSGNYIVDSIIDDRGLVRFWKNGAPTTEVTAAGNLKSTIHLDAGSYSIIIDAQDVGAAATGMAFSIKSTQTQQILRNSGISTGRSDDWCIFRTVRNVDLQRFILDAARCRSCFGLTHTGQN